jgi:hypothetical protein
VGIDFTARRWTRTDDSHPVYAAVGVSDKQQTRLSRHPNRDEPVLVLRVIRIIERLSEWIQVNGLGLIE